MSRPPSYRGTLKFRILGPNKNPDSLQRLKMVEAADTAPGGTAWNIPALPCPLDPEAVGSGPNRPTDGAFRV